MKQAQWARENHMHFGASPLSPGAVINYRGIRYICLWAQVDLYPQTFSYSAWYTVKRIHGTKHYTCSHTTDGYITRPQ